MVNPLWGHKRAEAGFHDRTRLLENESTVRGFACKIELQAPKIDVGLAAADLIHSLCIRRTAVGKRRDSSEHVGFRSL